MPKHTGGGVTSFGNRIDGLPSAGKVKGARPKPGLKGLPKTGKALGSNPSAAVRQGFDEARKPRS